MMRPSVRAMFRGSREDLLKAFQPIHDLLLNEGCQARPKTSYIAFALGEQTVAAVHLGGDALEVALALPDEPRPPTHSAVHLKWRTLPVALYVRDDTPFADVEPLLREALRRVKQGQHDVRLANERFTSGKPVRAPDD